jgi:3-hydroxybutyryl-CoA dehydrogenase
MAKYQFQTAAVIGTGMMGPGIAATLALGGVKATILSRTEDGAKRGLMDAQRHIHQLEQHGLVEPERAARACELVDATLDFDATIARIDLVIESAPENMDFKQKLFAHMDSIAKPDAILASNTSGLSITAIAAHCLRPERVLTTHFWNPPHLMPLVEIVKGEKTSGAAASSIRELLAHCGKVPVMVKKDRPGQLGNRLQMALVREAVHIVAEGIADVEDVDLAARTGFGLRLPAYGIFEHQDMVGLDLGLSIVDYVSPDLYNGTLAPALYRGKVAADELGVKTGKGFYDWSHKSSDEVKARRDRFLLEYLKSNKAETTAV